MSNEQYGQPPPQPEQQQPQQQQSAERVEGTPHRIGQAQTVSQPIEGQPPTPQEPQITTQEYATMDMGQLYDIWDTIPTAQRIEIMGEIQNNYAGGFNSGEDQNRFYMLNLRHAELEGINTRSPTTWIAPETQAFYQDTVKQSALESAQRQAEFDALSPDQRAQQKLNAYIGSNSVEAHQEMQLSGSPGVVDDGREVVSVVTLFSKDEIAAQDRAIQEAIANNDPRITPEGLQTLLDYQAGVKQTQFSVTDIEHQNQIALDAFTKGELSASDYNRFINFQSAAFQPAVAREISDQLGWELAAKDLEFTTYRDSSGNLVTELTNFNHDVGYTQQEMQLAIGMTGKLGLMGRTSEGRKAVYQGFALTGVAIGAVIVTGGTALAAVPAVGASFGSAFALGAAKTVAIGAGLGIGFSQAAKTGFSIYGDYKNPDTTVGWDTVKSSALSPLEVAESALTGIVFYGGFNVASKGLGLATGGIGQAGNFSRQALGVTGGRIGLGAAMGAGGSATSEVILTGKITPANVALGAALGGGLVGLSEGMSYLNSRYVQPRVAQRLDNNLFKSAMSSELDPFNPNNERFVDTYKAPLGDRILGKVTGVKPASDISFYNDPALRTISSSTGLANTLDNSKITLQSISPEGMAVRRGSMLNVYDIMSGNTQLKSSINLNSGIDILTGRPIGSTSVSSASSSSGLRFGTTIVPLESTVTGGEVAKWTGLSYTSSSGTVTPLIGRSVIPANALIKQNFVPETSLETKVTRDVLAKSNRYDPSTVTLFDESIKSIEELRNVDSKYFTGNTPTEISTITPEALLDVKNYLIENPDVRRVYGSFATSNQLDHRYRVTYTDQETGQIVSSDRKPGDIDIFVTNQPAAERGAGRVAEILKDRGIDAFVSDNRRSLTVARINGNEVHVADFHVEGEASIMDLNNNVQKVPATVFGFEIDARDPIMADVGLNPKYPNRGLPIRPASSQYIAKMAGSLIFRVDNGRGVLGAESWRIKDPVDAAAIRRTLVQSQGRQVSSDPGRERFMDYFGLNEQDLGAANVNNGLTSEDYIVVPTRSQRVRNSLNVFAQGIYEGNFTRRGLMIDIGSPDFRRTLATNNNNRLLVNLNEGQITRFTRRNNSRSSGSPDVVSENDYYAFGYLPYIYRNRGRSSPNSSPDYNLDLNSPEYSSSPSMPERIPSPSIDMPLIINDPIFDVPYNYVPSSPDPEVPVYETPTYTPPYAPSPETPPYTPPYTPGTPTYPYAPTPPSRPITEPTQNNQRNSTVPTFNEPPFFMHKKPKQKNRVIKQGRRLGVWSFGVMEINEIAAAFDPYAARGKSKTGKPIGSTSKEIKGRIKDSKRKRKNNNPFGGW